MAPWIVAMAVNHFEHPALNSPSEREEGKAQKGRLGSRFEALRCAEHMFTYEACNERIAWSTFPERIYRG
jgi:hypothetical protein